MFVLCMHVHAVGLWAGATGESRGRGGELNLSGHCASDDIMRVQRNLALGTCATLNPIVHVHVHVHVHVLLPAHLEAPLGEDHHLELRAEVVQLLGAAGRRQRTALIMRQVARAVLVDRGSWNTDPTPPTTRARVLTSGPKRRAE